MVEVAEKYALAFSSPTSITSERQHEAYLSVLDQLMSKPDLTSDEEKYTRVLLDLVEAYDKAHYPTPKVSPVAVLHTLMEANNLRQKDLAKVLGRPESTVSALLSGARPLTREHIEKFSAHFRLSPAAFF